MSYLIYPLSDKEVYLLNESTICLGEIGASIVMSMLESAAREKKSKLVRMYMAKRNIRGELEYIDALHHINSLKSGLDDFICRINSIYGQISDYIWDEELQTLRPATFEEQALIDYSRDVQYQFQLKADPNFLVDETERDDFWDEEEQTLRPATNEEQAIIDSARIDQYRLQLRQEAAPKGEPEATG